MKNTEEKGCTDALIAAVNCCTILSWEDCAAEAAVAALMWIPSSVRRTRNRICTRSRPSAAPQCGGEIYTNDHTIAGFCSYCGASAVLQQRTEQIKVPFRIFPFTVDKSDCRKRFRDFVNRCAYVPEEYKNPEAEHEFRGSTSPLIPMKRRRRARTR